MPELIDILDENGVKTGRVVTREQVHREGLWHRIAVVAALDNEDRILLQQRSKNKLTNPGKWDVAAAGHVDAGEDVRTTAMRETQEEIGILANDFEYVLTYQKESQYEHNGEKLIDRQIFDCFTVHEPEIEIDNLKIQDSEVAAVKLCTLDDFVAMIEVGEMVDRKPFYDRLIKMMEEK